MPRTEAGRRLLAVLSTDARGEADRCIYAVVLGSFTVEEAKQAIVQIEAEASNATGAQLP